MTREELLTQIRKKGSLLCIGLDTDLEKIPQHLHKEDDPLFAFNKAIIDATHSYAVAYKPNTAFYEAYGASGWKSLERTISYINENYPELFTIADAKRGDIGNTSERYAKAFLENLNFDSITVAPYMGSDSVQPFLGFQSKWVILLGLTSNAGATNFQTSPLKNFNMGASEMLFEKVLRTSKEWGNEDNMMYVIGATKSEYLKKVRAILPDHFLLIPGVGAQGGNLESVLQNGMGQTPNLLINSSRGIIYASQGEDFANAAAKAAHDLQKQMKVFIA